MIDFSHLFPHTQLTLSYPTGIAKIRHLPKGRRDIPCANLIRSMLVRGVSSCPWPCCTASSCRISSSPASIPCMSIRIRTFHWQFSWTSHFQECRVLVCSGLEMIFFDSLPATETNAAPLAKSLFPDHSKFLIPILCRTPSRL